MSRPDPIEYAERLYGAIRDAAFSPISFLAFGNAVKEGVPFRHMPRMAAEPFMRIVGEMLEMEEDAAEDDVLEAQMLEESPDSTAPPVPKAEEPKPLPADAPAAPVGASPPPAGEAIPTPSNGGGKRSRR
jgi:hypothetical protein